MDTVRIRSIHWSGTRVFKFDGKHHFNPDQRTFTVYGSDGKLSIFIADVTAIIVGDPESASEETTQSEPDSAEA